MGQATITEIQDDLCKSRLFGGATPSHVVIATVTFLVGLTDWVPLANFQTMWFVKQPCSCSYSYSRYNILCRPFMPILQTLVDIVEKILDEKGFNAININDYIDEHSALGYHSDGENLFQAKNQDSCIVSISFGATRRFAIRNIQYGTENDNSFKTWGHLYDGRAVSEILRTLYSPRTLQYRSTV